jgi:hypothetical protein
MRYSSHCSTDAPELYLRTFRERLIDVAFVLAYSLPPPRPAYFATMLYFTDATSETIIPRSELEALDINDEQTVCRLFAKPEGTLLQNLKFYLERTASGFFRDRAEEVFGAAAKVSLNMDASKAYWSSTHAKQIHGLYAMTYALVLERKLGLLKEYRARQKMDCQNKINNMDTEELQEYRRKNGEYSQNWKKGLSAERKQETSRLDKERYDNRTEEQKQRRRGLAKIRYNNKTDEKSKQDAVKRRKKYEENREAILAKAKERYANQSPEELAKAAAKRKAKCEADKKKKKKTN